MSKTSKSDVTSLPNKDWAIERKSKAKAKQRGKSLKNMACFGHVVSNASHRPTLVLSFSTPFSGHGVSYYM